MSEDVSVIIKGNRGTPPVMTQVWPSPVSFQLDDKNPTEATSYAGADPHYTYEAYTLQLPVNNPLLLRLNDVLIDQSVIDDVTGTNRVFRIVGKPQPYPDGHWEIVASWYRGS